MRKVKAHAFAKINPYLDVCSKREDGYHNIESLMQTVTLCDVLDIELSDGCGEITLECNDTRLPCDSSNLVYKAASLFLSVLGLNDKNIKIYIQKNIPFEAGLGGGSADAAATLLSLNELTDRPFDTKALLSMGKCIGADVPFCIIGGCARVSGIGEVIDTVDNNLEYTAVVAIGGEGVSTPLAFGMLDKIYAGYTSYSVHGGLDNIAQACENGDKDAFCKCLFNSFEEVILPARSKAKEIRSLLMKYGANASVLSGSGPSVVGFFFEKDMAYKAAEMLSKEGISAWVCRPIQPTSKSK